MLEISIKKKLHGINGTFELQVDHVVPAFARVTVFGQSGAGKSSILKMLAGLLRPDTGRIALDGEIWFDAANKINLPTQRRSIGLVFQDFALFPHLSVLENIQYGLTKLSKEERHWVSDLLAITELTDLQQRRPEQLSGGQKQRVALARALAHKPKLLLLDEPLSALDQAMRSQLQEQLLRLHEECGLITVLVSHDLGEIFKFSQTVLCLENGLVARNGTPAEVFLRGQLAGRLSLQAQVLAIRQEQVIYVLSLLIGQEVIEIVAAPSDISDLKVGSYIAISPKTFNPLIMSNAHYQGISGNN